ncbi:Stress responsive alpha-beta barrel domain protein isoform 1 [Hibiscus syriacus]|uniref:Stress responsive alpha-beta barrel domain protein isoform 1 n=1 Tax=Hibiscus syriacus TaxID=106335 RepID=A0A6A3BJ41_HIBSY|nr:stress-response A/B barrel domain-containing protein UP3 [Hibiscus syriacus]KAE8716047.1 Stress responsive alpha-beta barrel domain protein isoform 1 [Hibiscus syriacus]
MVVLPLSQPMPQALAFRSFPVYAALSSNFYGRHGIGTTGRKQFNVFSCANGNGQRERNLLHRRKVVDHICLLKANKGLSDEEEKDMLDYLYTSQYQMRGIVAISLGQISAQAKEDYTHAVFMRFQSKEVLEKFYENPLYLQLMKEHVLPYCHGLINVDYESEVEDDMLHIFRKGEEYSYGVEFVLLIAFVEAAIGGPAKDALLSLQELTIEHPSLVLQCTQGSNFNSNSRGEYTHGVVIRFRSFDALEIFFSSSRYKDVWESKLQSITKKTLAIHFSVDPVGTEIM